MTQFGAELALASDVALAVDGVSVVRDGTMLLHDVSFRVARGEHWVILGANGSGKTTLLNVLLAYVPAFRGTVSVFGHEHGKSDWRQLRRHIGIVSSSVERRIDGFDRALDVVSNGKNAMWGSWGPPDKADQDEAYDRLAALGCEGIVTRRFELLSQGERQRVLIARAWMARPGLLILDEPCAGLDPVAREEFLDAMEEMMGTPRVPAMLLVTHHVEEIAAGFTRALLLRRGRVLECGVLSDVVTSESLTRLYGRSVNLERNGSRLGLTLVRKT